MMDSKPSWQSRQTIASWTLSGLVLATSLALLALAANTLRVWTSSDYLGRTIKFAFHDHDAAFAPDERTVMAYWTQEVKLDDTHCYLVASILGLVLGSASMTIMLRGREVPKLKFAVSGRKTYATSLSRLPSAFALDICLLIIAFLASCLAWARWGAASWIIDKGIINNSPPFEPLFYYGSDDYHTLESWNCVLARNIAPDAQGRFPAEVRSLCLQGRAERWLILVLFALVLARVAMVPARHVLERRRGHVLAKKNGKSREEMAKMKNRDVDLESQEGESRGSAEAKELAATASIAELPADRTSKVEMDADFGLKELPSDDGLKELEAGVAAVETEAVESKPEKAEKI